MTSKPLTANRAFQQMRQSALQRLRGRTAADTAARTGIPFNGQRQVFSLSSLGREIQISYPRWEIYPAVDQWHQLLIFHYLDLADGTPLSGRLMGFGDLPGGMVRGGGFDRQSEKALKNLKEVAEFEGYLEGDTTWFKTLEAKLTPDLDRDFDRFKTEVKKLLETEIVKRYYYQKGELLAGLKDDDVLAKALEVLSNPALYRKTLTMEN